MEEAEEEASTVEAAVVSTAAARVDFMVAVATPAEAAVTMAEADTGADPTIAAADIIVAEVTAGVEAMAGVADTGVIRVTVMDGAWD